MTSTPITTADIAKGKIDDALSVREKIGYGLGDAGGTVITCLCGVVINSGRSSCSLVEPGSLVWRGVW